ncbi:MAG: Bax inhibitor-1 family protein [Proteobacteria bacterium]|nr:Bax inhibitor-1 family protein [Pseudomonadota bacterium]
MRYTLPAAGRAQLDVGTTNRVLRNTYTLLAITLLPTIAGAYFGALFPLMEKLGWISIIVFIGAMFGIQAMVIKNRNSAKGIAWLLFFTLVMGYFTGPLVGYALGSYSNGAELVGLAIGGTATMFFGLAGYATVTKRDFSSISFGKALGMGMWMLFAIVIVNSFFQSSAIALAVSSFVIVISSGLILFTINRIVRGGEDNYIMATMVLYIMVLNLFQSLLHLLMMFGGARD